MNEMPIRRAQKFLLLLARKVDIVQAETGRDLKDVNVVDLIGEFGDLIFEHLTDVFNFVFEFDNEKYEPVNAEWLGDNVSIRLLIVILEEIAAQNQMGWLVPFFQTKLLQIVRESATAPIPTG